MSLFEETAPRAAAEPMTFTVADLAERIKQVLSEAFGGELWVEGEIRNLNRARSGHMYFDLVEPDPDNGAGKQAEASVSVALFKFNRARVEDLLRRHGDMAMEDGIKVRIQGELDFWPPRGQLRLRMTGIDPNFTLGELEAERLRLLEKLRRRGPSGQEPGRALPGGAAAHWAGHIQGEAPPTTTSTMSWRAAAWLGRWCWPTPRCKGWTLPRSSPRPFGRWGGPVWM